MSTPEATPPIVTTPANPAGPSQSVTPAAPASSAPAASTQAAFTPQSIHTAREWLIAANPGVIPELIAGSTVEELQASLPAAKAAFDRAVAQVGAPPQTPAASGVAGAAAAGGQQPPAAEHSGQPPAAAGTGTATQTAPVVPAGAAPVLPVDLSTMSPEAKLAYGIQQRKAQGN